MNNILCRIRDQPLQQQRGDSVLALRATTSGLHQPHQLRRSLSKDNPGHGNEHKVRFQSPFKKHSNVIMAVTKRCRTRHHQGHLRRWRWF